jgi:PAS domain S-box-containing protein
MDWRNTGKENNPQDTLREYQEKYRILTEMMPLGAFRLGPAPDYRIVSANRLFPQMLGFDSGEAIEGIPVRDLMIDPAHWQQIETDLMRDGTISRRELQLKQKEGSGILVALNARVVPDSEVPVAWIDGVAEDVTEHKVLEMEMHYHEAEVNRYALALTRANEKLNLLSSITRHDILNQLTALSGYLELMSEGPQTPQTQKYIDIEKRIAQTIKKQIQFTRDYHDIGVHSPQWYNVKKTIETATAPLPLPNGTLSIRIENISIYADPLLEKVFYNLVENALRYGREQTRITFSSLLKDEHITIVCEDNGEGVPEEFKEAIFKRQHFKHTGFGLFLSREILGITGLSIRESGEPGKGARFEIIVPPGYFHIDEQAGH